MTPTASATTALVLVSAPQEAPSRPDLSAATGIMAAVAMSAVFWTAIGYAVDALIG
ncbi:hypothetical protein [Roseomonas haemaphysalidis]|jgi:hypothetical protein|uniref:EamA family transporter n=1 Tax=Roseomonas haemaphysalidis TaxID=2768162 RepID=A0ABS3KVU0_9PROT|nr:hypothetical protein [Roseomonas haemaphysalidis]MBO1081598.1 hypothetical protein [Roseomonas haemaphysalidis]